MHEKAYKTANNLSILEIDRTIKTIRSFPMILDSLETCLIKLILNIEETTGIS